MKKELVTALKAMAIVVAGVLVANAIERKYLTTKTLAPAEVTE